MHAIHKPSVLIAERFPDLMEIMGEMLEGAGYSVDLVFTLQQALDNIEKNDYDLVTSSSFDGIADRNNPGSVLDIVDALNKKDVEVPLLFISGHPNPYHYINHFRDYDRYVQKVFDRDEFVRMIDSMLEARAKRAAAA